MIARKNEKKPAWMFDAVWDSLLSKWNCVTYQAKCSQAQQNQKYETGGSLHTGGSISRYAHAIRMLNILNINSFYYFFITSCVNDVRCRRKKWVDHHILMKFLSKLM